MHSDIPAAPSADAVLKIVRGELSSARRWLCRLSLAAASLVVAAVVSLWTTEARPLPWRLHAAFAAMTCIGIAWIGVFTWILTRRSCPTALDRLATTWMATLACCIFIVVSLSIALLRGQLGGAVGLILTGAVWLALALCMLRGAYAMRARLRRQLADLED